MNQETQKERLIRIMGTFDLATGHADTFDELLDSLESELRDLLEHYRAAVKEHLTQEPVAMLERTPRLGILRVTYEDAVTELHEGLYPLYVKPPIEVGCAECGVNGGHALYCVACAEKFVGGYKDSGVPAVETGLEQVSPDTQPQRTWVGLTDEEKLELWEISRAALPRYATYSSLVEAKLKELNT
jgi:hypothetical protein